MVTPHIFDRVRRKRSFEIVAESAAAKHQVMAGGAMGFYPWR